VGVDEQRIQGFVGLGAPHGRKSLDDRGRVIRAGEELADEVVVWFVEGGEHKVVDLKLDAVVSLEAAGVSFGVSAVLRGEEVSSLELEL
jgi:hypothetical protein